MAFKRSLKTNWVVQSYDTTGKSSSDLNAFEFAILDKDTYTSLSALNVQGKDIILAVGSPNQGQRKSGLKIDRLRDELNSELSFKSQPINVNAIKSQKFTKDNQTNVYYFGYNGTDTCKTLEFECGKTYQFDVYVKGRAVRNIFGREMREVFQVTAPCCTPCTDGDCSDSIECAVVIDDLVAAFNDPNRWISRFYTAEKIQSCSHEVTPETSTLSTYCLTVCDAGTANDLANVQQGINDNDDPADYFKVKVKERNAPYTTYEVMGKNSGVGQPSNFVIDGVVLEDCNECPSGFTLVQGGYAYLIETAQDGSDSVTLGYMQSLAGLSTVVSISLVNYSTGLGLYYVVASTELNAETINGESNTLVKKYLGVVESTCTQDTAVTYVWEECATCDVAIRYLTVTVGLGDCDVSADPYAEWVDYLAGHSDIEEVAALALTEDGCKMRGTVIQYSNCLEEGCDTTASYAWPILAPFMGQTWEETDDQGDPCADVDVPTGCSCGIKFTGVSFSDLNELLDLPVYDILEYTEKDPIELTVSLLEPDGTTQVCEDQQPTFWHTVYANYRTLHGRDVMKEILLERKYRAEPYWNLTNKEALLLQKAEGLKYGVDVDAYYFAITISGNLADDGNWSTSINKIREDVVLFIHEDNVTLFNNLRGFLAGAFPNAKFTDLTGVTTP